MKTKKEASQNQSYGYVYFLYDGVNKITRIGKTKAGDSKRQRGQIGYAANPVINFCTIQVENYSAVEKACHAEFMEKRLNGD
ncbi:GIY-YIG nuclease family protein [Rufibacter roseolus]|uniref:GIY-YIG nuclease family protein n=1 Tax=Rufibacter roseolus TaxID=2817375 RepID=UPI001B300C4C|nr:GIY-YIG nuclease family protein [Rufibacter roseolus]